MSDLGLLSFSLGLEFVFAPSGILVTQRSYFRALLSDFGLDSCNPAPTPMVEKLKLEPKMSAPPADSSSYQQMVGKLIFLAPHQARYLLRSQHGQQVHEPPSRAPHASC